MADEKKVTKRDQVKEAIITGEFTKAQIAENLEMSLGSVSSQMTYLRWMGMFIKWDENKVLSMCTSDEFDAWEAENKANRKSPAASKLTPEEQSVRTAKTLGNQAKSLVTWEKKLEGAIEINDDDATEENQDYVDECEANIVLLKIKIKRNEAKAADLPEPVEVVEVVEETVEADGDEELL